MVAVATEVKVAGGGIVGAENVLVDGGEGRESIGHHRTQEKAQQ